MLFLVLVIFNGHITSRSIVPHVLGHFTLSSYVASPSSVGMDPSLLVPLGDLKQGGKVADLSPGHLLPPHPAFGPPSYCSAGLAWVQEQTN